LEGGEENMEENEKEELNSENPQSANGFNKNYLMVFGVILLLVVAGVAFSKKGTTPSKSVLSEQSVVQPEVNSANTSSNEVVPTEEIMTESNPGVNDAQSSPIAVEVGMFYFKPNVIRVKKGQPVKIVFTNKEGIHDFVINELNVQTQKIKAGESETVEFTPEKTGSFEFYCSVSDHRAKGMKGTLVVE
jgi:Heme/copper-type cytochrome/quinol oxidases, subunit 2